MSEKTTDVGKRNTTHVQDGCRVTGGRQSGQTIVEYAILVSMVTLLMVGSIGVFMSGLGSFYLNLVKVVTLPFP